MDNPCPGSTGTNDLHMIQGPNAVFVAGSESLDGDRLALLSRFEEAIVLAAMACGPDATAGAIKTRLAPAIGERHINCVLTTLDRLSCKGIVESTGKAAGTGLPGRRRKIYQVTTEGRQAVERGLSIVADLAREAGFVRAA